MVFATAAAKAAGPELKPSDVDLKEIFIYPEESREVPVSFYVKCDLEEEMTTSESDEVGNTAPPQTITCGLSSDRSWLALPASVGCNSSFFTVLRLSDMVADGPHEGHITVTCEGLGSSSATVRFEISRQIRNRLTISPSEPTLIFTKGDLYPKSFSVRIQNQNPENSEFTWTAQPLFPEVKVYPSSGIGPATVTIEVDPRDVPSGEYEDINLVVFHSNLDQQSSDEGIFLRANVYIYPVTGFQLFPSSLSFVGVRKRVVVDSDNSTEEKYDYAYEFSPASETVRVYTPNGFDVVADAPWIEVSSSMVSRVEGVVQVQIREEMVRGLLPGTYRTSIRIFDRKGSFSRAVKVSLRIVDNGEPFWLPVSAPEFLQFGPQYVSVSFKYGTPLRFETPIFYEGLVEESKLDKIKVWLTAKDWLEPSVLWAYYPYCPDENCVCACLLPQEREACLAGLRKILSESARPAFGFWPVQTESSNGTLAWSECLPIARGPLPIIDFDGHLSSTRVDFEVRVGESLADSVSVQKVEARMLFPFGKWQIIDDFDGEPYYHKSLLEVAYDSLKREAVVHWYGKQAELIFGDDSYYFAIIFPENGFQFEYRVTSFEADQMEGIWRYWKKGRSENENGWRRFRAIRVQ